MQQEHKSDGIIHHPSPSAHSHSHKDEKKHTGSSSSHTGSGSSSSSGSGGTTSTPSGTIRIINFGNNGAALASNSALYGTYLGYPWSMLEPTKGQFNWSIIDNDMKPWLAAKKNVIIRVSASGWASWGTHPTKSWTPGWVYGLGVQSITDSDGATKPQYWAPAFLSALGDFVKAFAAQYDGNSNIIAIECGIGDGGETKPDTRKDLKLAAWQSIGYNDQVWFNTIKAIIDMYKAAFVKTPIAIMPDNSFLGKTAGMDEHAVVAYAVSKGCWLQHNGIIAGIKRDPTWTTTIIGEQRLKLAQSGDTLAQDLQLMMDFGCSYAMCFEQDLTANQAVLAKYAALVQH